jgi:hypothetical protein
MKVTLKFEEKDFDTMRSFEKAVKKQLGNNVYVGTSNLCLYFDYPKELYSMLRPYPPQVQLEFELESSLPDQQPR